MVQVEAVKERFGEVAGCVADELLLVHQLQDQHRLLDVRHVFQVAYEPRDRVRGYESVAGETLSLGQEADAGDWVPHRFQNLDVRRRRFELKLRIGAVKRFVLLKLLCFLFNFFAN